VGGCAPRALKDSVRRRRLSGRCARPLNFTVRPPRWALAARVSLVQVGFASVELRVMRRRIGDIYRLRLANGKVGYMQHLANDLSQLGGNVVLVLSRKYLPTEDVNFDHLSVHDGFFAHVFLKAGETLGIWERVKSGRPAVHEPLPIVWSIYSHKDSMLETSENWQVWRTNEQMHAPFSQKELDDSELGIVINPTQIVQRIEHSTYSFRHPRKGRVI
jgi:hypothetical protein